MPKPFTPSYMHIAVGSFVQLPNNDVANVRQVVRAGDYPQLDTMILDNGQQFVRSELRLIAPGEGKPSWTVKWYKSVNGRGKPVLVETGYVSEARAQQAGQDRSPHNAQSYRVMKATPPGLRHTVRSRHFPRTNPRKKSARSKRMTEVERLAWSRIHSSHRHTDAKGNHFVLELDKENGGTVLTPLKVVAERMAFPTLASARDSRKVAGRSVAVNRAKRRKMESEWVIQGLFPGNGGWEDVTAESTWKEARQRLREYRENDRQHAYRAIHRRVPVAT